MSRPFSVWLTFAVTRGSFVPLATSRFTALPWPRWKTGGRLARPAWRLRLLCWRRSSRDRSLGNRALHGSRALLFYLVLPLLPAAAVWFAAGTTFSMPIRIGLSLALVLPIAPLLDRIVFRPIADASVLLLLTVAVALHFALSGLGLLFFGPEGVRTKPLTDTVFDVAGLIVNGQTLLILAASIVFCGLLFLYFEFTIQGKALRATAINRIGARLVGIRPTSTGTIAYLLASLLAGISGVLIAPVTTIFYDSGFLLGLKAFVGAIIGAMVSYPVTALGAVMVGLLESFTSFWLSAYKEVLVFSLLIPSCSGSLSIAGTEEEGAEE